MAETKEKENLFCFNSTVWS